MIRRGFWLAAGAVTGIYGYRRVSAVGRRLSASLNPASANTRAALTQSATLTQTVRQGRRTAVGLARETYRFTRDVREGMDLYLARHSDAAGSTLGAREALGARETLRKRDARDPGRPALDRANHDPRPKDGR